MKSNTYSGTLPQKLDYHIKINSHMSQNTPYITKHYETSPENLTLVIYYDIVNTRCDVVDLLNALAAVAANCSDSLPTDLTDLTNGDQTMPTKVHCASCEQPFDPRRKQLGYNFCLDCGDFRAIQQRASWTIAPIAHKQGATLITNRNDLKGLNKYTGE